MKKHIFSFLLYTILVTSLSGQWRNQCPLRRPEAFKNPTENLSIGPQIFSNKRVCSNSESLVWMVRADREGLQTSTGKLLKFRKVYVVVEEKVNTIHIVSANLTQDGKFTNDTEDFGWIDKRRMLLWREGLMSQDQYRIKVIATHTLSSILNSSIQELNQKKLTFYSGPNNNQKVQSKTGAFRYYYVFKEENGFYLLGRRNASSIRGLDILGWVSKRQVIPWNSRQIIEPNWDESAIQERLDPNNRVRIMLFDNQEAALAFTEDPTSSYQTIWNDGFSEERWSPYIERLPVFERVEVDASENKYIYRTGVIGKPQDESGRTLVGINNRELARIKDLKAKEEERARKINVVFIIDATKSMQKYIDATRDAMINIVNLLKFSDNDYEFGLMVYRDVSEKFSNKCADFESTSRLMKDEQVLKELEKLIACHDKDEDPEESLYHGLLEGMKLFNNHRNEQNVVILVGDAGPNDLALQSDVSQLLDRYNASVIAIQARSENIGSSAPYDLFVDELRPLIMEHAQQETNELREHYSRYELTPGGDISYIQVGENRTLWEIDTEVSPVLGSINFALSTRPQERPNEVAAEVVRQINLIDRKTDERLSKVTNLIELNENTEDNFLNDDNTLDIDVLSFLKNAGVDPEKIEGLLKSRFRFLIEGYAATSTKDLANPLFKLGLFVDQEELDIMKRKIEAFLRKGSSTSEKRDFFKEAFTNAIREFYGERDVAQNLQDEYLSVLLGKITGMESTNSILKNYKFRDLPRMTERDLTLVQIHLTDKLTKLKKLRKGGPYSFVDNTFTYHWIPFEYLP